MLRRVTMTLGRLALCRPALLPCRFSRAYRGLEGLRQHSTLPRPPAHVAWLSRGVAAAAGAAQQEAGAAGGEAWEDLESRLPTHCSGCGVELQQQDPNAPG